MAKRRDARIRFYEKFEERAPNDCWPWIGWKNNMGYGMFDVEHGRKVLAHRFAYERHHSITLPRGQSVMVLHSCDNPACVNPAHLLLGSQSRNIADAYARDRRAKGSGKHYAKLTESLVLFCRRQIAAGKPIRQLAREIGVHPGTLDKMWHRQTWKHVE